MKLRAGVDAKDIPLDVRLGLIIFLRYSGHWTFQEVGDLFGVSRQRVHQITSEWEQEARKYVKGGWIFEFASYNGPGLP